MIDSMLNIQIPSIVSIKSFLNSKQDLDIPLKIFTVFIALFYLFLFLLIEKIPYDYVLSIFIFLTHGYLKWCLVVFLPFFLYLSLEEKTWGYVLVMISFMAGQFLFVHVFGDDYRMPFDTKVKDKTEKHYYSPTQNLAFFDKYGEVICKV